MQSVLLRDGLRIVLAAVCGLVLMPASAQVVLFEDNNFQGRTYSTDRAVSNLAKEGFNDKASSVDVRGGRWQLCADADFGGQCITLDAGRYASLGAMGMNDKVSSLRPLGGALGGALGGRNLGGEAIVLYEHANFAGQTLSAGRTVPNLASESFNDKASSIVVNSGQWQVCSEADFKGNCVTLDPGRYASLSTMGLNDKVSSLRATGRGYRGADPGSTGAPQIVMGVNSEGQVVFPNNPCVASYNPQGLRWKAVPACTADQLRRADEAMVAYRRGLGLD